VLVLDRRWSPGSMVAFTRYHTNAIAWDQPPVCPELVQVPHVGQSPPKRHMSGAATRTNASVPKAESHAHQELT
jgi:hypothetical protein